MNIKQIYSLRKRVNQIVPDMESQNKIMDMFYKIEANAEKNILNSVLSDLHMKLETVEDLTEELESEENPYQCPYCDLPMKSIYDNVGFADSEGEVKNEIIGLECTQCGHKE